MLDVDQRSQKERPSSLAQWAYQVIGQPGVCLRVRLRGNNLHILCETPQELDAKTIVNSFKIALKGQEIDSLPLELGNPIDQIIVYGRTVGHERPNWIEQIRIKSPPAQNAQASEAATAEPTLRVSNESLARSGSPEAIAHYLSETLITLGVSVKVLIQDLKEGEYESKKGLPPQRRLWVICNSNYSPDALLLAEPIIEKLRALQLKGFRDAAICAQVSGEAEPEWMLRVDLTPKEKMLKDWARWGDVQAIARILNQALSKEKMAVRSVLKEATLHLFCSILTAKETTAPDKQTAVKNIVSVLEAIAPQGIQAVMVYGVKSEQQPTDPEQETPLWIEWLNLATATLPGRAESVYSLAQKGNQDAITFLLERLINPDLDRRLATGGIYLKVRRKKDLLHIMSEAPVCPPQAQVGPPITRFLRQLAIPEIAGVRVYGRRAGSTSPAWNYGVDLAPRRRLVPEATPEFAATDAYVNELVAPTGEPVLRPDLTKKEVQDRLKQTVEATVRILQRLLCYSQLFVPTQENPSLGKVPQRTSMKSFSSSQGMLVVIVWSLLGLLMTFLADRLLGQQLHLLQAQSHQEAIEVSDKSLPLPQVSLQKGGSQGTNNFNRSGFTREGNTSVIIDEADTTVTPQRASAAKAAILAAARSPNPSFNNPLLDEKLALYQQRLLKSGPPDVLILGSSRALRGVDPIALQDALAKEGYPDIEVFNFGINGATAQVVDLVIRRILMPEQLPKLIIWADGARAFNSGRMDATYNAIATSAGYQHIQAGTFPNIGLGQGRSRSGETAQANPIAQPLPFLNVSYQSISNWLNQSLGKLSSTYPQRDQLKLLLREHFATVFEQTNVLQPQSPTDSEQLLSDGEAIGFDGFLPLSVRFNPATYYQRHPRVTGDYDRDYESFKLQGEQDTALEGLLQFAQANDIRIVFVNLPLTRDYLDPTRAEYEAQFQRYMRSSSLEKGLIFRDLTELLVKHPDYFSDPSHLNRYGAYKVSQYLAQDPMIPWSWVISE